MIIARQGKHFDNLLSRLPDEGRVKYLSMWEGYIDESNAAYNQALAMSVGDNYRHMHTSGHCDMKSLEELITVLNPYAIIPIHTDNPQAFADLFSDKWPVILLNDGDSFSAIKDSWHDTTVAKIFAYKKPDKSHKVIDNLEGLQDSVIVKPLVGVETELGEISSETTAQRIYIFPYKKLKL